MFDEFETTEDIQHQVIADSNIYYNYGGQVVMNESQTLGQWMNASGDDTYSISSDPGFHDPFRYNFGFDEGASAGLLGFRQNEVIDVGPRKSVWDADGAVWINYPETEKQDFLPSDNKSLHFWISAKDIGEETVNKWEDRTYNKFNFYHF